MLVSESVVAFVETAREHDWRVRGQVRDWLIPASHDLRGFSRGQLEDLVRLELADRVRPGVARVLCELLRRSG